MSKIVQNIALVPILTLFLPEVIAFLAQFLPNDWQEITIINIGFTNVKRSV